MKMCVMEVIYRGTAYRVQYPHIGYVIISTNTRGYILYDIIL